MITAEIKQEIINEIKSQAPNFPSQAALGTVVGLDRGTISKIINGYDQDLLSDKKWLLIARKIGLKVGDDWKVAKTMVFQIISSHLQECQRNSVGGILCDDADIGKSFTAKIYCRENKNAFYIDCSQYKTKNLFIRGLATTLGVNYYGRYKDVYEKIVDHIIVTEKPLIVLDEFGDLTQEMMLEFKALWNATERSCGWYAMGADGLAAKINRNLNNEKIGWAEIFSRLGGTIHRITPDGKTNRKNFKKKEVAKVAKANGATQSGNEMVVKTKGSLRRVHVEIQKTKTHA